MSATALMIDEQVEVGGADLGVEEVLDAVREFGLASLGLVAWEYSLPETAAASAWAAAVSRGLIFAVGTCPATGETLFAVAD
jgi:hypothetical protein